MVESSPQIYAFKKTSNHCKQEEGADQKRTKEKYLYYLIVERSFANLIFNLDIETKQVSP